MKILSPIALLLILLIFSGLDMFAQGSAGSKTFYESRYIVDMPTAGVLTKGTFSAGIQAFPKGGLMLEVYAAPFRNFNLGLSYGGAGIIGDSLIRVQNLPGFHLRWRIIDETYQVPGITIGASTQGRGFYCNIYKRFQTQSPGLYVSASKNFKWLLGSVAFHGGVTYSFEPPSDDRSINIYAGLEQSLGSYASVNLEFNPNFDDNNTRFMKEKGLLNASLRWSVAKGLTVELQIRDMLRNINRSEGFGRTFALEFIKPF